MIHRPKTAVSDPHRAFRDTLEIPKYMTHSSDLSSVKNQDIEILKKDVSEPHRPQKKTLSLTQS